MKREYTTPKLHVHGSVEELTLASQGPNDPKPNEGNDGCGLGQGQGSDGRERVCS